jgi:hypothetical protein
MFALMKEASLLARISYYRLAMSQMGPLHADFPRVLIHVTYLREQLNAVRWFSA